jgi:hypothetical protein
MPTLSGPHGPTADASPAFSWTAVAGATRYVLILDDLTTGQRRATVRTTDLNWTPTAPLVNGHVYRWKVSARNAAGQGMWTLPLAFRVTL